MTPQDRRRFAQVLASFAEIKRHELSREAVELYWQAMQDWPIEAFEQAAVHLLRTSQWFPTPADFEALREAGRLTATEAWAVVRTRVTRGLWRLQEDDPSYTPVPTEIARTVAAVGGWASIAKATEGGLARIEKAFLEQYVALERVARVRADCSALASTPREALTHDGPTRVAFPAVLARLQSDAAPKAGAA